MPKPKNGPGGHGGAPRGGFQKPKNMGKTVSKLFSYLGKSKGLLVLVIIFVLLSSVGMIASSYFIKIVIDNYLVPMTNDDAGYRCYCVISFQNGYAFHIQCDIGLCVCKNYDKGVAGNGKYDKARPL